MSETRLRQHPIFDPDSLYRQLRNTLRGDYKVYGYFLWQRARMKRLGLVHSESSCVRSDELRRLERELIETARVLIRAAIPLNGHLTSGRDFEVLDAHTVAGRQLRMIGRDSSSEVSSVTLCLIREADGGRSFTLHIDQPHNVARCRAFLMEPEGVQRMKVVATNVSGRELDDVIAYYFDPAEMERLEIAQMLAACADMDGEVINGQLRFARLPVPSDLDALPPRPGPLTVVLVVDEHPDPA